MLDYKELDETVFIPDEEFSLKKDWVNKNIKGMDWRDGYVHQKIYNELSFRLGVLDKIEQTRERLTLSSAQEIIKMLWILDYGSKQIAYWLWKWGYKGISYPMVRNHIASRKRHWKEDKEKFMAEIVTTQEAIFHTAKQAVMEAEKKTMEILLGNIRDLQEELKSLHPVKDKAEYNSTLNQIIKLEERCKNYHGLQGLRDGFVRATTEVAIHKGKMEAERAPDKAAIDAGSSTPQIMERTKKMKIYVGVVV